MIPSDSSSGPLNETGTRASLDETDIKTSNRDISADAERESLSIDQPRQEAYSDYSDCSDVSASGYMSSSSVEARSRLIQFASREPGQETYHAVIVSHCEEEEIAFQLTQKIEQRINNMNKTTNNPDLNIISIRGIRQSCWKDGALKACKHTKNIFLYWTPSFDNDVQCREIAKELSSYASCEVYVTIILDRFSTPEDRQKCREKLSPIFSCLVLVYNDSDSFYTNINQRIFSHVGTKALHINKRQSRTRSSNQKSKQRKQRKDNLEALGSSSKNGELGVGRTSAVTSDLLSDTTAPVTDDSLQKISTNRTECTTSNYKADTASIAVQNTAGHQTATFQRGVKESSILPNTRSQLATASSKRLTSFNSRDSQSTTLCSKVTEDVEAPTMDRFTDLTVDDKVTEKSEKHTVSENSRVFDEQTPNYPPMAKSTTLTEKCEASQQFERESVFKDNKSNIKLCNKQDLASSLENVSADASLPPDVTTDVSFNTTLVTDVSFNTAPVTETALPMQKEENIKLECTTSKDTPEVKDCELATALIAVENVESYQNTTVLGPATDDSRITPFSKRIASSTQGASVPQDVKAPLSTSSMEKSTDLTSDGKAGKPNEHFTAPVNSKTFYKCNNDEQTRLSEKGEVSQIVGRKSDLKIHEANANLRNKEDNCSGYLNLAASSSGSELNTNSATMSPAVISMTEQTPVNSPLEAKSTLNENSEASQLVGKESDLMNLPKTISNVKQSQKFPNKTDNKNHSENTMPTFKINNHFLPSGKGDIRKGKESQNLQLKSKSCSDIIVSDGIQNNDNSFRSIVFTNSFSTNNTNEHKRVPESESLTNKSAAGPEPQTVEESDAKSMDNAWINKGTASQPNKGENTDDDKSALIQKEQRDTRSDDFFEDAERIVEQKQKVGVLSLGETSSDKILESVLKFEMQVPGIVPTAPIVIDDTEEKEKKGELKSVRTASVRNQGFANVEPTTQSMVNDTCKHPTYDYQESLSFEESAGADIALDPCLKNSFEGLKGPHSLPLTQPNPYPDDAAIDLKLSKIQLKVPVQEMQPLLLTEIICHPSAPMPIDMAETNGSLRSRMLQTTPETGREQSKETQTSEQSPPSTAVQPGAFTININIKQAEMLAIGANNETPAPVRAKTVADSEGSMKNGVDDQHLAREPLLTDDHQTAEKHDTRRKENRSKQNTLIKWIGGCFCFRSKQGKSSRRS